MVIVVSLPFIYFKAYCEYPKTGFYCNDESIAYPYRSISIYLISIFRHLTKSFYKNRDKNSMFTRTTSDFNLFLQAKVIPKSKAYSHIHIKWQKGNYDMNFNNLQKFQIVISHIVLWVRPQFYIQLVDKP